MMGDSILFTSLCTSDLLPRYVLRARAVPAACTTRAQCATNARAASLLSTWPLAKRGWWPCPPASYERDTLRAPGSGSGFRGGEARSRPIAPRMETAPEL